VEHSGPSRRARWQWPIYCLKVTAQSAAPVFIDAIEYNVPDVIE
jgi:hypothetical protein